LEIQTIGFAGKTAEAFFTALKGAGTRRVIDVRLKNTSQLAAFAKKKDLPFFLEAIVGATYVHAPFLAPTRELLKGFRNRDIPWEDYAERFKALLVDREVEKEIPRFWFADPAALLCSENKPDHCHRRLVAEYLAGRWGDATIVHL